MEQNRKSSASLPTPWVSACVLAAGVIGSILYSPKWHSPFFAWTGPLCLLYFFRLGKPKGKYLWFVVSSILIYLASVYEVAPLPIAVLAVLALLSAIHNIIIYAIDKWLTDKADHFIVTLFFPAAFVLLEYLNISIAGGSWWSIGNTQYPFKWLIQLASVTGVQGISFIIYWFGSVAVWAIGRFMNNRPFKIGIVVYGGLLTLVLLFGAFRYYSPNPANNIPIKIAGISVPDFDFKSKLYMDYYGRKIILDPKTPANSPILQKVNKAWFNFIETADTLKYKEACQVQEKMNDSLFTLSQKAADQSAKIICWSEGSCVVFQSEEKKVIDRGKVFAAKNKVYLLMAVAMVKPGKITPDKKFIENKTIFIDPSGNVVNVFYKNKPVPGLERTRPGDGKIPVIASKFGNISPSICYDADFPANMIQLGKNHTALLLLPAGDWFAIAPYHSYMAVFRGIENGCSVFRQASGGLSIASDYRGKSYGTFDFYKNGTKLWFADIPVQYVPTPYANAGNIFIYCCLGTVLITICYLLIVLLIKGRLKYRTRV